MSRRAAQFSQSLIQQGWDLNVHSEQNISNDTAAQFVVYYPHNHDMIMSLSSVDVYMKFLKDINKTHGDILLDSEGCASYLAETALRYQKNKNKSDELITDVGLAGMTYMASTKSGQIYLTNHAPNPFTFITVMYPMNKAKTTFTLRPAVAGCAGVMSPDEIIESAKEIMNADIKLKKKFLFKYLK